VAYWRTKAEKLNLQLELASDRKEELLEQIKSMENRNKELIISKIELCTSTSVEMHRMRGAAESNRNHRLQVAEARANTVA